jgi:hypothetical protein
VSFAAAVNYVVGTNPMSVTVADFNGDGKPDLAVANWGDNTVSVLLGKGDGTFQEAVNCAAGTGPLWVTVGDFNGDGKPDLAVANIAGVSVLLGNGDGTFQPAANYPAGIGPRSITVGDFDGDGKLDLAVTNGTPAMYENVSVLLGNGDGTFQPPAIYTADHDATSVTVGDFNGDGYLDLAVTNQVSHDVSVLLGYGDGTFQPPANNYAGFYPYSVTVGDLNGDGKLDLAVTDQYYGNVDVLLGKGDGTFQDAVNYAAGTSPFSVAVGDFNGDGKPDLAVTNDAGVSVLLGKGDGTFQAAVNYVVGTNPMSVTVADFNGDGKPDLAVASGAGVSVLLNTTQTPITELLIPSGGTNVYQFANNLFNHKVTYPALSPPVTGVYLAVWPILISQADLNARLASQFPGATLVPYDGTGGFGVLFRATCQDSSGNPAECPQTKPAYDVKTSWNSPAGQTINYPAFLMADIAPVGQQKWMNIFTAYSETRIDPTGGGRTKGCCSDFVFVQNISGPTPTININTPQDGADYALNQNVLAKYDCDVNNPLVTACIGTVPSGSPIDTSSPGSKTFEVNAVVSSGPSADQKVTYHVGAFGTCHLYDPTVKSGWPLLIKLELCDASGHDVSSRQIALTAVSIVPVSTKGGGTPQPSGFDKSCKSFLFIPWPGSKGWYTYALNTKGLQTGTYLLNFTVSADTTRSPYFVPFQIK